MTPNLCRSGGSCRDLGAVKTALLGAWLIQALRTAENEGKAGVWLVCWLRFLFVDLTQTKFVQEEEPR